MSESSLVEPSGEETAPHQSRARAILGWAVKLAIPIGIFIYLFETGRLKPEDLKDLARRWDWVLCAMALMVPTIFTCAWRYQMLLRALDVNARYWDITVLSMIGMLFDLVSISNGGDLVKAVYLSRAIKSSSGKSNFGLILFSVLLDRIVGLFALFTFALIVSVAAWPQIEAHPNLRKMTVYVVAVCVGGLLGFFVLVSEKLEHSALRKRLMHILPFHERLERTYAGFAGLRHHKRILLMMLGLSVFNHMLSSASVLLLAHGMQFSHVATSLPAELELIPTLTVLPLCLFLNTFGFAGGFGAGTIAFEELFRNILGVQGGAALAVSYQISAVLFRLAGIPFLIFYRHKSVNTSGTEHVISPAENSKFRIQNSKE